MDLTGSLLTVPLAQAAQADLLSIVLMLGSVVVWFVGLIAVCALFETLASRLFHREKRPSVAAAARSRTRTAAQPAWQSAR
jgi:hypothetical protein